MASGRRPAAHRLAFGLFLGMLLLPGPLSADSDGYYCVGADYFAYQLRSWHWYNFGEHRLIVFTLRPEGVRLAGYVDLGVDFQPHAMSCDPQRVRLEGWRNGYIRADVAIAPDGKPEVADVFRDADRPFDPADFTSPLDNLGDWSTPGARTVARFPSGTVDLVIRHDEGREPGTCTSITTRLVHRGVELNSPLLYRGVRECGHVHD